MRSILEKAIVHLLNDEKDKADELFHQFMIERARQIHESIRLGEDDDMENAFDDEMTSEEYFDDEDLESVEDDVSADEAELDADESELSADMDDLEADESDVDADVSDLESDVDAEEDLVDDLGMDDDEVVDERLSDIEDQLQELTDEFEKLMASIDEDHDDVSDDADEDTMELSHDEDHDEMSEDMDETHDEMDDEEVDEGRLEIVHHMDEDYDDDDEFDDITESVTADLMRLAGLSNKDFSDDVSPLPQRKVKDRIEKAGPSAVPGETHKGFDRETAPKVSKYKLKNENSAVINPSHKKMSKEGDSKAKLNKDYSKD